MEGLRALVWVAPEQILAWRTLAWALEEVNEAEAAQEAKARAQAIQRAAETDTEEG